ncbi:MAG: allantoicase, partial [Pseudomonadota bacterium]
MSDHPFASFTDLAQQRLGGAAVAASDDFFADRTRINEPAEPVFIPGKYDENGKWMDGWESRRRRDAGHDWCVIRLGAPGRIVGLEIDTRHFTGNFPPAAMIEACSSAEETPSEAAKWTPITETLALNGDDRRFEPVASSDVYTHVRLNIYPDGGVARLRVYGEVYKDWSTVDPGARIDLAAAENGGRALACNDEHFGRLANLLAPGRGVNMGDGWETRRRREPGADWGIIALARPGRIEEILLDTAHFKGNYPDRCSIQAAPESEAPVDALIAQSLYWPVLLPEQKLYADREHHFSAELSAHSPVKFIRLNLIPD